MVLRVDFAEAKRTSGLVASNGGWEWRKPFHNDRSLEKRVSQLCTELSVFSFYRFGLLTFKPSFVISGTDQGLKLVDTWCAHTSTKLNRVSA